MNDSYRFISELMDLFLMAGVHQQPDQSNYLAEGQTLTCEPYWDHCDPMVCRH